MFWEGLEPRRLMHASVGSGVITINGAAGNVDDTIEVTQSGSTLTVNHVNEGSSQNFSTNGITKIVVNAGAGDDVVRLQNGSGGNVVTIKAVINGGTGADNVIGGKGNDTIRGDDGNDTLSGGLGDDLIDGGKNADRIRGDGGVDAADYSTRSANVTVTIDDAANDGELNEGDNVSTATEYVVGGSGNDKITGSGAANFLIGGAGIDTIRGGGGNDTLQGGDKGDKLYGEAGNDSFFAKDGIIELLDGGAGTDFAQVDAGEVVQNLAPAAARLAAFAGLAAGNGELDGAFGAGGKLTTDFGVAFASAGAVTAWQADGKLVVAGTEGGEIALARYNADGSLDASFGVGGRARALVPDLRDTTGSGSSDDAVVAVGIQPNGKIVVAGRTSYGEDYHMMVARFTAEGSLDDDAANGFGPDRLGYAQVDFGTDSEVAYAMAFTADQNIVIAGQAAGDFAVARLTSTGRLDVGFSDDGIQQVDFSDGQFDKAQAIAIQPDGRIVVGGTTYAGEGPGPLALARLNADGSLDDGSAADFTPSDTFGVDGRVVAYFGEFADVRSLALDAQGRIVAGGTVTWPDFESDALVARFTTFGELDASFGGSGMVAVDFGAAGDTGTTVLLPEGGQILIAGTVEGNSEGSRGSFAVGRLNDDGTTDFGYGAGGVAVVDFPGGSARVSAAVLAPFGQGVVAVGTMNGGFGQEFALARFTPWGTADGGFGIGGRVTTSFGEADDFGTAMVIRPDGKFYVAGTTGRYDGEGTVGDFALSRYNVDGSLDQSFGQGGRVTANFSQVSFRGTGVTPLSASDPDDAASAVLLQPDGKVVVAGSSDGSLALTRFNPDGSQDQTFGDFGLVVVPVLYDNDGTPAPAFAEVRGLAMDADGRIVAAGYAIGFESKVVVARFNPDGTLDATFGGGGFEGDGIVVSALGGGGAASAYAVAVDDDGGILTAGGLGGDIVLARFTADGSLDTAFGSGSGGGYTRVDFFEQDDGGRAIALQRDRILVGGYATSGSIGDFALAGFTYDGLIDPSFAVGSPQTGRLTTDFFERSEVMSGLAVAPDESIVAVGTVEVAGGVTNFGVVRYTSVGTLDDSFGLVTTAFGPSDDSAAAVGIQSDGNILVAGSTDVSGFRSHDFAVARYLVTAPPPAADVLVDVEVPTLDESDVNRQADRVPSYIAIILRTRMEETAGGENRLVIDGTGEANEFHVRFDPETGRILVVGDGVTQSFDESQIDRIVINAGNGSDLITVDPNVTTPMILRGGNGNDTILAGSGNDQVFGENGNDRLDGGAGNDTVDGGNNDDEFSDRDALPDTVNGGLGSDRSLTDPNGFGGDMDLYNSVEVLYDEPPLDLLAVFEPVISPFAPEADLEVAAVGDLVVTSTADTDTVGTLRHAILFANANAGLDTITFAIPGAGVHTIAPGAALPTITEGVIIDGTSQGEGFLIELSGADAVDPEDDPIDGLFITAGGSTVKGLVINAFGGHGIHLATLGNNVVAGNRIGTDATGTLDLGNGYDGVFIDGVDGNTIGGATAADGNLISGNSRNGVGVSGGDVNAILNNVIGTNAAAPLGLGNGNNGIDLKETTGFEVRGNIVSENHTHGVRVTDADIVGTLAPTADPVRVIAGNYIGTSPTADLDLGNGGHGVYLDGARGVTVGGPAAADANVIAGNDGDGVRIAGVLASGNAVVRNYIGTNAALDEDLGNNGSGVGVTGEAHDNVIGDPAGATANVIAFNAEAGVSVGADGNDFALGNAVLGNDIFGNVGPAIDLASDGPTPNDAGDADFGPNELQNAPELASAYNRGGQTIIAGVLDAPEGEYVVQFFTDATTGSFIGEVTVTVTGAGPATFTASFPLAADRGTTIRATATGEGSSTSEVSGGVVITTPGVLQFSAPTYTVGESGTTATITVTRTDGSDGTVSVDYATADGTAADADDYLGTSGTLTFADGQTSRTFTVSIVDDALDEANETVALSLSGAAGGAVLGATDDAVLTITDNDNPPAVSVNDMAVTEGNSATKNAVFTVKLSGPSGRTVVVPFSTAGNTATSGTDFNAASGNVTFAPGETTKTITVQVKGDTTGEADETYFVNLGTPSNATVAAGQGVGTIVNDDGTVTPPTPSLRINDVTMTEGNAGTRTFTFTVTLSAASASTVTVKFATANGTATVAGNDYNSATGTLTFTPGQTSKLVTVTVKGDTAVEGNETFFVNLSAPTNATIADNQGLGTITNDDVPPATVTAVIITDPCDSSKTALLVTGTDRTERIDVEGTGNGQAPVRIKADGRVIGTFTVTGRVIVYAKGGNDTVYSNNIGIPVWVFGGMGNDNITGGRGDDLLLGEGDNDTIVGGNGHDILIGGTGADVINGNLGNDVLVAGTTDYDGSLQQNCLIANKPSLITASNVHDDTSVDTLLGGGGNNVFFMNVSGAGTKDKKNDSSAGDKVTDI